MKYWIIKSNKNLEPNSFNELTLYATKKQASHVMRKTFPLSLIKLAKLEVVQVELSIISQNK